MVTMKPWTLREMHAGSLLIVEGEGEDWQTVAEVYLYAQTAERDVQRAAVMAAAPQLLAALEAVRDQLQCGNDPSCWEALVQDALTAAGVAPVADREGA